MWEVRLAPQSEQKEKKVWPQQLSVNVGAYLKRTSRSDDTLEVGRTGSRILNTRILRGIFNAPPISQWGQESDLSSQEYGSCACFVATDATRKRPIMGNETLEDP